MNPTWYLIGIMSTVLVTCLNWDSVVAPGLRGLVDLIRKGKD